MASRQQFLQTSPQQQLITYYLKMRVLLQQLECQLEEKFSCTK